MMLFERLARNLNTAFNWVALAALSTMLLLVSADIIGAKLLGKPFPGALDLLSLLGVLVIGFSTTETYLMERHIRVTFVSSLLPPRLRKTVRSISLLLCLILFAAAVWRLLLYAGDLLSYGESSITVNIPLAPFAYALGISLIPMVMILIIQLYRQLKG